MGQNHRRSLVTVVSTEYDSLDLTKLRVAVHGVRIQQHRLLGQGRERKWNCDVGQRRADHLLSDAIFFVGRDMQELVALYLAWINSCGGRLAIEQIKPWGYLCLPSEQALPSAKEEFLNQCCLSRDAGHRGAEELQFDAFQMLAVIAWVERGKLPRGIVSKAARRGRRQRSARGQLWTPDQLASIRGALQDSQVAGDGTTFSIAGCVSTPPRHLRPGSDWARVMLASGSPRPDTLEVIASYLAHHACTSANWACWPRGSLAKPDSDHHFTRHHFNAQYRPALQRLLLLAHVASTAATLASLYPIWRRRLAERVGLAGVGDALRSHLTVLEQHRDFLAPADFGFSCGSCLAADWLNLLPCGRHGLCNQCALSLDANGATRAVAYITSCTICALTFAPYAIAVHPMLARARILALDGGGMRGLFQLAVLERIQKEMALSVPIARFFDLIVGTSVGGINALALGLKPWSVERCREHLATMSKEVFGSPSKAARAASWLTGGWSALAGKMLRVWLNNAIYDSTILEKALQHCFGQDVPLIAPTGDGPAVAVTTTTPGTPACALLTTYNKNSHPVSPSYIWHQRQSPGRDIRVWEAARCTSAAPVYFAAKVVSGIVYWDGGPLNTNPDHIASSEGSLIWDCPADQNLVISVGCGQMNLVTSSDHWAGHLRSMFDQLSSGANQGVQRASIGPLPNYIRLDPMLGIESIGLDDVESMLSLQTRIESLIREDESFNKTVKTSAWKLIASSFFAEARLGECSSLSLQICCRLNDAERAQILEAYPDCYFSINQGSVVSPIGQFPCTFDIPVEYSKLDITLNIKNHSASISGCPTTITDILHSLGQPLAFTRKRSADNRDD